MPTAPYTAWPLNADAPMKTGVDTLPPGSTLTCARWYVAAADEDTAAVPVGAE